MERTNKLKCTECDRVWASSEILTAQNPFTQDESCTIAGCPECLAIDQFVTACDEPGCTETVSMGTPTPDGYRSTCYKHAPRA